MEHPVLDPGHPDEYPVLDLGHRERAS